MVQDHTNSESTEQRLGDALEGFQKELQELWGEVEQNETVFAHFYQGDEKQAGAIRVSRFKPRPNVQAFAAHETWDFFTDHIRVFGRECTFLKWMSAWVKKKHEDKLFQHTIVLERPSNDRELIVNSEQDDDQKTDGRTTIQFSSDFLDLLCPQVLTKSYFEKYLGSHGGAQNLYMQFRDAFVASRGRALTLLKTSDEDDLKQLADVLPKMTSHHEQERELLVLGALQSILVFHRISCNNKREESLPIVCQMRKSPTDDEHYESPMHVLVRMPVQAQYANKPHLKKIVRLQERNLALMSDIIIDESDKYADPSWLLASIDTRSPIGKPNEPEAMKIRDSLGGPKGVFQGRRFTNWRIMLTYWMIAIIQRLREQVHEGERLGFWLVAGDKSLIDDSPDFHLRPLMTEDPSSGQQSLEYVKVPKLDKDSPEDKLRNAARAIGALNYPWFQDGRYALFWDATFPNDKPVGLLEVRNSTWERWEATLDQRDPHTEPPLVLVHARPDGTAGLAIGTNRVLVARRRNPRWKLAHSLDRENAIIENCFEHLMNAGSEVGKSLARIVTRVAEDPRRGCMIVILDSENEQERFQLMGEEPWQPKLLPKPQYEEDLVALVSMDGATCIFLDKDAEKVKFYPRRLVGPPFDPMDAEDKEAKRRRKDSMKRWQELTNYCKDNHEHFMGMGTRRWGGALASTCPWVTTVIVVSQDGDIHIWKFKGEEPQVFILALGDNKARLISKKDEDGDHDDDTGKHGEEEVEEELDENDDKT